MDKFFSLHEFWQWLVRYYFAAKQGRRNTFPWSDDWNKDVLPIQRGDMAPPDDLDSLETDADAIHPLNKAAFWLKNQGIFR